jgi:hypothetical protein
VDAVLVPIIVACITAVGVIAGPVLLARVKASLSASRPEPSAVYSTAEAFVRAIAADNDSLRAQIAALRADMGEAQRKCDAEIEALHKEITRLSRSTRR